MKVCVHVHHRPVGLGCDGTSFACMNVCTHFSFLAVVSRGVVGVFAQVNSVGVLRPSPPSPHVYNSCVLLCGQLLAVGLVLGRLFCCCITAVSGGEQAGYSMHNPTFVPQNGEVLSGGRGVSRCDLKRRFRGVTRGICGCALQ